MGSFGSVLGSLVKPLADKVGDELADKGAAGIWREFGPSMETVAKSHPAGAVVADSWKDFVLTKQKALGSLNKPVEELWEGIKGDSKVGTAINTKHDSIGDIHTKLEGMGHPLKQKTQNILLSSLDKNGQSTNQDLKLHELGAKHEMQSNLMASATVFGPNMENLIPSIEELFSSKDPHENAIGQFLVDATSNLTHDNTIRNGAPVSKGKQDIFDSFKKKNALNTKFQTGAPEFKLPNTAPVYTSASSAETSVRSFLVNRMADMAAIPHLSMLTNISSAPMKAIVSGMMGMGDREFQRHLAASNVLSTTLHSIFDKQIRGANAFEGKLGKTAGSLFYNAFHMPLFDQMRFHQLSLGAAVGYHSAITWGAQTLEGNKRAITELTQMRLDPLAIAKRGGKLTDEELQIAMFHYANDKFFISKPMDQTLASSSNVYMRSATMFHKTINSQYYFVKNELSKMYKAGDLKGIAQFAGTLGILFPAVAPWIKSLSTLARTASPSKAKDDLTSSYSNLSGKGGVKGFASSYIDMLSYSAGIGIYLSYTQAANHDRLASAVMGPLFGEGVTIAQDAINAIKTNKKGEHNLKPLGRDASELGVPVVGKWMGYKLFPTKNANATTNSRRLKRRRSD